MTSRRGQQTSGGRVPSAPGLGDQVFTGAEREGRGGAGPATETLGRGGGGLQLAAVRSKAERACAAGACPGADVPRGRGCGAPRGARGGPGQGAQGLRLRGRVGEGQPRAPPRPLAGPRLRAARGYPMPL